MGNRGVGAVQSGSSSHGAGLYPPDHRFFRYGFSLLYEVISGYLRGFGISALPAFLTFLGVCGTRLFWIWVIFPRYPSFQTVMRVYPLSLIITALLLGSLLLVLRPARRYEENNWTMFDNQKKEV